MRDALRRHTPDVLRRLCAARVEESKGRLDRSHTRRLTLCGVEQVEPQIFHGRPLVRMQATVTMQEMVLHHTPAMLHLRDVLGLAPHHCLAFHAVPAIVLLHKSPVVVPGTSADRSAATMRAAVSIAQYCATSRSRETGRLSQHGPDGMTMRVVVRQRPQGPARPRVSPVRGAAALEVGCTLRPKVCPAPSGRPGADTGTPDPGPG